MSANNFVVRNFSYHNELRAVVFNTQTATPVLLPLLYSTFRLSRKSLNTQRDGMLSLSLWMQFWSIKFNKEFEEDFFCDGLDCALDNLDAFLSFLQLRSRGIKSETLRHRLRAFKSFLNFLNDRYTTSRYLDLAPHKIRTLSRKYNQKINTVISELSGSSTKRKTKTIRDIQFDGINSLIDREVETLLKIVRPDTKQNANPYNPWKSPHVQIRNYLMIKLMLDYGLRRGEVLLLTTKSFVPNLSGHGYSLIVTDVDEDERSSPPSIKTKESYRTLFLAHDDYDLLSFYVRTFINAPKETFLFLGSKTKTPLSLNQVNYFFNDISNAFKLISRDFAVKITPHVLRHTCDVVKQIHTPWLSGFL